MAPRQNSKKGLAPEAPKYVAIYDQSYDPVNDSDVPTDLVLRFSTLTELIEKHERKGRDLSQVRMHFREARDAASRGFFPTAEQRLTAARSKLTELMRPKVENPEPEPTAA